MAVPWVQIVQWVPSILEVSRQILKETRKKPGSQLVGDEDTSLADAAARIAWLEENERRQAELINQMAEHIGQLTLAVTELRKQMRWLIVGQVALVAVVVIAVLVAQVV